MMLTLLMSVVDDADADPVRSPDGSGCAGWGYEGVDSDSDPDLDPPGYC